MKIYSILSVSYWVTYLLRINTRVHLVKFSVTLFWCLLCRHGRGDTFSWLGIRLTVDWFKSRAHEKITVFVPSYRVETATNPEGEWRCNQISVQMLFWQIGKVRGGLEEPTQIRTENVQIVTKLLGALYPKAVQATAFEWVTISLTSIFVCLTSVYRGFFKKQFL